MAKFLAEPRRADEENYLEETQTFHAKHHVASMGAGKIQWPGKFERNSVEWRLRINIAQGNTFWRS